MIYGIAHSRFKYISTEIDLNYSILHPDWRISNLIEHKSIINGKKNFILLSYDHMGFDVTCNIFKETNPATKLDEILTYNHTIVKFMPHSDDDYIKDSEGNEADFYIAEMKPYYMANEPPTLYDKIFINFVSLGSLQVSGVTAEYLINESSDYYIDESGGKLKRI